MIKYVLCPGYVRSKTDGQTHYVGANTLAMLYGVPMDECVIEPTYPQSLSWKPPKDLQYLYPRDDGNYRL